MLKPPEQRGLIMSDSIRQRVQALGLTLPTPSQPIANYVNHVISQNQLFVSGQIPLVDGKPAYVGRLGESVSDEEGAHAAELAALGLLGQLSDALGDDLSRLVRTVRLGVFIASRNNRNAGVRPMKTRSSTWPFRGMCSMPTTPCRWCR
jgi:enamine deaminase RidA (YjgF/YER057c/UK114 family)